MSWVKEDRPGSKGIIVHQEIKHRRETRGGKVTETNVPLGKQLSRASPTSRQEALHMASPFPGGASGRLRGERGG